MNYQKGGEKQEIEKKKGKLYETEEVESYYSYPSERKIKGVQEQLTYLRNYFPALQFKATIPNELPKYAEGLIIIPKIQLIAPNYNIAIETVLNLLKKERAYLMNWREGELGREYLRYSNRSANALKILGETTKGDYLVIPAQLGQRHLGRSARRTQVLFEPNEFGLGPFEITVFLLTHPEWLSGEKDLGIDCIGAGYSPYKHGFFTYFLFFYFLVGKLRFGDRWQGCPDKKFGPATGFIFGENSPEG